MRRHVALLLGVAAAGLVLVLFAFTGINDLNWHDWRPLGIIIHGWGIALLLLTIGLGGQLLLNARESLHREGRLVEVAALLRAETASLEELAMTDQLTGLPNRRSFDTRLGIEFRRAQRYGRPLSVALLDLDFFKRVNDSRGHAAGDMVLIETASLIRRYLRESDVAARYGGEEFIVLLPESGEDAALVAAEKLRQVIEAHRFGDSASPLPLTVSIGVASLPYAGIDSPARLVELADRALYRAKETGRNRVVAASVMDMTPFNVPRHGQESSGAQEPTMGR